MYGKHRGGADLNNGRNNNCSSCNNGEQLTVMNLECMASENNCFRKAVWSGENLQVTLMSIPVGGDIGAELHEDADQLLCITQGCATVSTGNCECDMRSVSKADSGNAILVPAGTWHNVTNSSNVPLKLFSVYAPPHHAANTVQNNKPCDC